MGLLNLIFGKSYEDHERAGDTFFRDRVWGQAKIEYETALYKLEKNTSHRKEDIKRLQEKFGHAREALSFSHKQGGEEMMESGSFENARALLALALELTQNPDLARELKGLVKKADDEILLEKQKETGNFAGHGEDTETLSETEEGDDYFIVLCSTLPPHIQNRYMEYGSTEAPLERVTWPSITANLSGLRRRCQRPWRRTPSPIHTSHSSSPRHT